MKGQYKTVLFLLLFLLTIAASLVSNVARADAIGDLENFLKGMTTFQANFTQQLMGESGEIQQRSKGRVSLAKPGRFRWDYEEPYRQQIIANGKKVWFFDEDLDQVTIKILDASSGATPALLLSGEMDLHDDFELTRAGESDGLSWVELTPVNRVDNLGARKILLGMQGERLGGMDLVDNFGQRTQIFFTDTRLNESIEPGRFVFEAPPGVDVFEE